MVKYYKDIGVAKVPGLLDTESAYGYNVFLRNED